MANQFELPPNLAGFGNVFPAGSLLPDVSAQQSRIAQQAPWFQLPASYEQRPDYIEQNIAAFNTARQTPTINQLQQELDRMQQAEKVAFENAGKQIPSKWNEITATPEWQAADSKTKQKQWDDYVANTLPSFVPLGTNQLDIAKLRKEFETLNPRPQVIKDKGIFQVASEGFSTGMDRLGAGAAIYRGADNQTISSELADLEKRKPDESQIRAQKELKKSTDAFNDAKWFADSVAAAGDIMLTTIKNPKALVGAISESLGSSIAPQIAGTAAGAAAGSIYSPIGTVVGGVAGYGGTNAATNILVEAGSQLREGLQKKYPKIDLTKESEILKALNESPEVISEAKRLAAIKGGTTAGVETAIDLITAGIGSKLMKGGKALKTLGVTTGVVGQGVGEGTGAVAGSLSIGGTPNYGEAIYEGTIGAIAGSGEFAALNKVLRDSEKPPASPAPETMPVTTESPIQPTFANVQPQTTIIDEDTQNAFNELQQAVQDNPNAPETLQRRLELMGQNLVERGIPAEQVQQVFQAAPQPVVSPTAPIAQQASQQAPVQQEATQPSLESFTQYIPNETQESANVRLKQAIDAGYTIDQVANVHTKNYINVQNPQGNFDKFKEGTIKAIQGTGEVRPTVAETLSITENGKPAFTQAEAEMLAGSRNGLSENVWDKAVTAIGDKYEKITGKPRFSGTKTKTSQPIVETSTAVDAKLPEEVNANNTRVNANRSAADTNANVSSAIPARMPIPDTNVQPNAGSGATVATSTATVSKKEPFVGVESIKETSAKAFEGMTASQHESEAKRIREAAMTMRERGIVDIAKRYDLLAENHEIAAKNKDSQPKVKASLSRAKAVSSKVWRVLQNRNRQTPDSIAQMTAIAANPIFDKVADSREMASGAPVVFADSDSLPSNVVIGRKSTVLDGKNNRYDVQYAVVEADSVLASNLTDGSVVEEYEAGKPNTVRPVAGNGRAAGIKQAYANWNANNYKASLIAEAENLGLNTNAVNAMRSPVLVRVMPQAQVTDDIGDLSNIIQTAALSPVDQAKKDAKRLKLDSLEFDDNGVKIGSVIAWINTLPTSEASGLRSTGTVSRQAIDRLNAAIFYKAYGSDELVRLYAESTDAEAKNIIAAAGNAAPLMSQLEGAGEYDIRGAVVEAVGIAVAAKRKGVPLKNYLQTVDFTESGEGVAVSLAFADNARSAKAMSQKLMSLAQGALDAVALVKSNNEQGGFFEPATPKIRQQLFQELNNAEQAATITERNQQRAGNVDAGSNEQSADNASNQGNNEQNGQERSTSEAEGLTAPTRSDVLAQQQQRDAESQRREQGSVAPSPTTNPSNPTSIRTAIEGIFSGMKDAWARVSKHTVIVSRAEAQAIIDGANDAKISASIPASIPASVEQKMLDAYNNNIYRVDELPPNYTYREVGLNDIENIYGDIDEDFTASDDIKEALKRGESIVEYGDDQEINYATKNDAPNELEFIENARIEDGYAVRINSIDSIFSGKDVDIGAAAKAFAAMAESVGYFVDGDRTGKYMSVSKPNTDQKTNKEYEYITVNIRVSDHSRTASFSRPDRANDININLAPDLDGQFFVDDFYTALEKLKSASVNTNGELMFGENPAPQLSIVNKSVQAFFLPSKVKGEQGKIYLIADRIEKGTEASVWLHEVFHKRGEELLGKDNLKKLYDNVQSWKTRKPDSVERQIYDAANKRAEKSGEYSTELLAYAIEEAKNRGVTPDASKGTITASGWLAKVKSLFTNALRKLTGYAGNIDLSANDLMAMAYGAAGIEYRSAGKDAKPISLYGKTFYQVAQQIAKRLEAVKSGSGMEYVKGKSSQYYRLPNGKELRISDHSYGDNSADVSVVIDSFDEKLNASSLQSVGIITRDPLGIKGISDVQLVLDGTTTDSNESYAEYGSKEIGFNGDMTALELALGREIDNAVNGFENRFNAGAVAQGDGVIATSLTPFDGIEKARTPIGDTKTVTVDGKEYSILNSDGKPIHGTVEGVRNFIRWFGDSKVTHNGKTMEQGGKPMVVYHGSKSDFSVFDNEKIGSENDLGWYGEGHYFTADKKVASSYAQRVGESFKNSGQGTVYPAYLNISNPLLTDGLVTSSTDMLKVNGKDGVLFWDDKYMRGMPEEIVAFSPEQIKSATGNTGDFNPANPDIRFSLSDTYTYLNTGKKPAKKGNKWQDFKDATVTKWVDATRPFDAFMRDVGGIVAASIVNAKDRAPTRKAAFERDALVKFIKPMAKSIREAIDTVKDKNLKSFDAVKELAGTWMSARYAIEKNGDLINQDRKALADASAALAADPTNQDLMAAENEAQNNLNTRIKEVNDPRDDWDVSKEPSKRGLAGGYNNATAAKLMADIEAKIPKENLESIAKHVYAMMDWKLDQDIKNGKVSAANVASWFQTPHYVPLTGDPRNDADEVDVFGTGSVNVSKDKKLEGRTSSTAQGAIDAAIEQIGKSANYHAWVDFKDTLHKQYEQRLQELKSDGKTTDEAVKIIEEDWGISRARENVMTNSQDSIIIRKAGQTTKNGGGWAYTLKSKEATEALRGANKEYVPTAFTGLADASRLYARAITQFMPGFAIWNWQRDIQERVTNIATRKIEGYPNLNANKVATKALSYGLSPKTLLAAKTFAWRNTPIEKTPLFGKLQLDKNDPDYKLFQEMIEEGGLSTWGSYLSRNSEETSKQLEALSGAGISGKWENFKESAEGWNNTFDMISSFAVYKALRSEGVDAKTAATSTLNLMNFKKAGSAMRPIGAFYIFANPVAQGANQLLKTLSTRKGKALYAAYLGVGIALYALLSAGQDDEELGLNKMDNESNFVLERNILIPDGDGGFYKLPVGFGLPQLAWSHAVNLVKTWRGSQTAVEAAGEISKGWLKTFAPVSPSESSIAKQPMTWLTQTLSPTLLDPFTNIGLNVNSFGGNLANTAYTKPGDLRSEKGKQNTPEFYKDAANALSGISPNLDVYPEQLRELAMGYLVGPLREILKFTIENPSKEERGIETVPQWAERMYGKTGDKQLRQKAYYNLIETANDAYRKAQTGKVLTGQDAQLAQLHIELEKDAAGIRGKRGALTRRKNKGGISDDVYNELRASIDEKADESMLMAIKKYARIKKEPNESATFKIDAAIQKRQEEDEDANN